MHASDGMKVGSDNAMWHVMLSAAGRGDLGEIP